jgi:drug/metabolite transporter (DMT)-like permease
MPVPIFNSRENLGFLLGLIGVMVFAGTLPFTKLAVATLDPWFVSSGRALVAGLLSSAIVIIRRRPFPVGQLRLIVLAALTICGFFPVLLALGVRIVPVSHAGVVLGVIPLATAACSALVNGERPTLQFWLAGSAGAALVIGFSLRDGGGSLSIGDIYLFLAALATSIGYVAAARIAQALSGWEAICWICIVALPITVPVTALLFPAEPLSMPGSAWIGFGYVSLFSMFLGFFAWNAGLAIGGVARVSQLQLLQTFFTLVIAIPVNGEHAPASTWIFAAAVVLCVLAGKRAGIGRRSVAPD